MDRRLRIARVVGNAVDVVARQVHSLDIRVAQPVAKRPSRHRADMLLELIDDATILGTC